MITDRLEELEGFTGFEAIACGGYSTVYRAEQPAMSRRVAIKVLRVGSDSESVRECFDRECSAAGLLSVHPHVVSVYERGFLETGEAYLVMEYLPGGSVNQRIAADGPLSVHEVQRLAAELGGALHSAHSAGVLHRDVKPSNVLYSTSGGATICDFGMASILLNASISHLAAGFTPAYASPEQLLGEPATPVSDVYGLAATIHFALTGSPPVPIAADSFVGYVGRVIHQRPPELDGVPRPIAEAIRAGLAVQPTERPADILQFVTALCGGNQSIPPPVLLTDLTIDPELAFPEPRLLDGLEVLRPQAAPPATHDRQARRRTLVMGSSAGALAAAVTWGALSWAGGTSSTPSSGPDLAANLFGGADSADRRVPARNFDNPRDALALQEQGTSSQLLLSSDPDATSVASSANYQRISELDSITRELFGIEEPLLPRTNVEEFVAGDQEVSVTANRSATPQCRGALGPALRVAGHSGFRVWTSGGTSSVLVVANMVSFEDTGKGFDDAMREAVEMVSLEFGATAEECKGFDSDGVNRPGISRVIYNDLPDLHLPPGTTARIRRMEDYEASRAKMEVAYVLLASRGTRQIRLTVGYPNAEDASLPAVSAFMEQAVELLLMD